MQHIFDLGLLHLLRIDLQTKLTNYSKINYTCIGFLKSCSREYVTLLALYQEPLTQHLYLRYYKETSYFIYSITTKLHIHGLVKELEVGKMQLHEYIQHSIWVHVFECMSVCQRVMRHTGMGSFSEQCAQMRIRPKVCLLTTADWRGETCVGDTHMQC